MPPHGAPSALVSRALSGDSRALRELIEQLSPVVQARAMRVLQRHGGLVAQGRDRRQELRDMTQEVFVSLLENGGRTLRSWEEERGLSLENFVGLVAERQVASILRTGKRSPWTEAPTESGELDAHAGETPGSESHLASREIVLAVLDRLRLELSPRMLRLFHALWVEELAVPEICRELQMQPDAVYTARLRISRRARDIANELSGSPCSRQSS